MLPLLPLDFLMFLCDKAQYSHIFLAQVSQKWSWFSHNMKPMYLIFPVLMMSTLTKKGCVCWLLCCNVVPSHCNNLVFLWGGNFRLFKYLSTSLNFQFIHSLESIWTHGVFYLLGYIFCGSGDWTQDITHGKSALYHWDTPSAPFKFIFFGKFYSENFIIKIFLDAWIYKYIYMYPHVNILLHLLYPSHHYFLDRHKYNFQCFPNNLWLVDMTTFYS
jgi:hypothetical protein